MTVISIWVKAVIAVNGASITRAERDLGNDTTGSTDGIMDFAMCRVRFPYDIVQPLLASQPAS